MNKVHQGVGALVGFTFLCFHITMSFKAMRGQPGNPNPPQNCLTDRTPSCVGSEFDMWNLCHDGTAPSGLF